jgi:2,4-dienoyl-CoA reductase (NADPH2)
MRYSKADRSKKVWVIGGGPGGLKTAEIAALRGHQVKIFERKNQLGGRVRLGANPPKKDVLNEFIDYLVKRVKTLGVTIEMGKTFTADMLDSASPDAVVVATGASPQFPDWQGIEESGALSVDDVLSDVADIGDKVLVVGGGGTGAEIADYLSEAGKRVTLVEMLEDIGSDLIFHLQHYLKQRLGEKGVTIHTSAQVKELGKGYAMIEDASGIRKLDNFDSIILALGSEKSNDVVYKNLEGKVSELHVIGDAHQPREIVDAVYEGEEIAIKL